MPDFSQIPKEYYPDIKQALDSRNLGYLILMHDKYSVTDKSYCCCKPGDQGECFDMFDFANDQKLFDATE